MRLASDSGAFADWIASSSSGGDLSLGFNASGPTMAHPSNNGQAGGMWSSAAHGRHVNDGLPQDFVLLTPASSFQHHHPNVATVGNATVNVDPHSLNAMGIGVGVGVIPLLTTTPCLAPARSLGNEDVFNNAHNRDATDGGGMRQLQHQQVQNSSVYLKQSMAFDHPSLLPSEVGASSSSISGGSTTCKDCGNQAKKDCPHRRCRTCCKSRGYDCPTHVRSTWVPAARRRERQLVAETTATAGSSQSTSGAKKPKLGGASQTTTTTASHTSNSNTTPPRSFDTTSSHRDASFTDSLPAQVRAPAVFKCVKVTALDDGEDEYAYQAAVRIGGHLFQGFLYDQGFEGRDEFPNMSELHLSGGGGGVVSSPPGIDPSDMYAAASGGGLLGGSAYGNPIN